MNVSFPSVCWTLNNRRSTLGSEYAAHTDGPGCMALAWPPVWLRRQCWWHECCSRGPGRYEGLARCRVQRAACMWYARHRYASRPCCAGKKGSCRRRCRWSRRYRLHPKTGTGERRWILPPRPRCRHRRRTEARSKKGSRDLSHSSYSSNTDTQTESQLQTEWRSETDGSQITESIAGLTNLPFNRWNRQMKTF